MKKILILLLVLYVPSFGFSQAKKFSFSIPLYSIPVGGPMSGITAGMKKQGFGDTYSESVAGKEQTEEYPAKDNSARIVIRGAFRVSRLGSIYIVGGISQKGKVKGFMTTGFYENNFLWTTRHSVGIFKEVKYSLFQAGGGYEYTAPRSNVKLAAAASAFFYSYSLVEEGSTQESTIIPGLNLNMRAPLGKGLSFAGLEFFMDVNFARAVNMKEITSNSTSFKATKTTMVHGSVGLALSLRAE